MDRKDQIELEITRVLSNLRLCALNGTAMEPCIATLRKLRNEMRDILDAEFEAKLG